MSTRIVIVQAKQFYQMDWAIKCKVQVPAACENAHAHKDVKAVVESYRGCYDEIEIVENVQ